MFKNVGMYVRAKNCDASKALVFFGMRHEHHAMIGWTDVHRRSENELIIFLQSFRFLGSFEFDEYVFFLPTDQGRLDGRERARAYFLTDKKSFVKMV